MSAGGSTPTASTSGRNPCSRFGLGWCVVTARSVCRRRGLYDEFSGYVAVSYPASYLWYCCNLQGDQFLQYARTPKPALPERRRRRVRGQESDRGGSSSPCRRLYCPCPARRSTRRSACLRRQEDLDVAAEARLRSSGKHALHAWSRWRSGASKRWRSRGRAGPAAPLLHTDNKTNTRGYSSTFRPAPGGRSTRRRSSQGNEGARSKSEAMAAACRPSAPGSRWTVSS